MQGIFQKENTDKALKYGIYRHLPTYEKIIRNLVSFSIKNFILRVLGLFLVSYSAIVCVEIGSPYGFDSIGFISKNELPYTLALTLSAVLVSFLSFWLYKIHKLWSCILMRGITNIYISVLFLIVSFGNLTEMPYMQRIIFLLF